MDWSSHKRRRDRRMADADAEFDLIAEQASRFASQTASLGMLGRKPVEGSLTTWLIELARGRWTGLSLSEDAGGSGLSTYELCAVAAAFGRALLPPYVPLAAAARLLEGSAHSSLR